MSGARASGWAISSGSEDDELPALPFKKTVKKPLPVIVMSDSSDEGAVQYIPLSKRLNKQTKSPDVVSKKVLEKSKPLVSNKNVGNVVSNTAKPKASNPTKEAKKAEVLKRKVAQAELKSLKPEECLKRMICFVDNTIASTFDAPGLIQWLNADSEATFQQSMTGAPLVKWKRQLTFYEANNELGMNTTEDSQDEPEMLAIIHVTELVKLVRGHKLSTPPTLSDWVSELRQQNAGFNVHLVCLGVEKYLKKVKSKAQRDYRKLVSQETTKRKPKSTEILDITRPDLDDAMVSIQLTHGTNVIFVESLDEFVLLVQQITKSVAEAPYKRMKRQNVQFINEKTSIKVNAKSGEGSKKVWRQILLQFHNVSPDMANAIVATYPSMTQLFRAYTTMSTSEGEKLLSDLVIRRGVGTLESQRRIGPELSKRIHKMMTSSLGDEILF